MDTHTVVMLAHHWSLAAAVNPGQALLLGNILSVFTSSDMVARGNFIALIFFVMSLGILVIYFIMGWSTNTIAQVRASMGLKLYPRINTRNTDLSVS